MAPVIQQPQAYYPQQAPAPAQAPTALPARVARTARHGSTKAANQATQPNQGYAAYPAPARGLIPPIRATCRPPSSPAYRIRPRSAAAPQYPGAQYAVPAGGYAAAPVPAAPAPPADRRAVSRALAGRCRLAGESGGAQDRAR
ncbi:hypothetical protein ACU4GD_13385 [Cupriavidus basilensis]